MARLQGKPGSYDIPSRGQVITKGGLVTCPDEDAHEFIAYGFEVLEWDGPQPQAPRPEPKPIVVKGDAKVLRDSLDYTKDKVEEKKTEHIMSTGSFGSNDHPSRARTRKK